MLCLPFRCAVKNDNTVTACWCRSSGKELLVGVPDIGGEFPVGSDLFPDDDILASDLLWLRPFCSEREGPDLAGCIAPEWLHVHRHELHVAYLLGSRLPECQDSV